MGDSPVGAPPNGPALAAYKPSTKHPFTPTAQDGFEFVADPKSTVTNFAQIGHENNLADALATGYAASTGLEQRPVGHLRNLGEIRRCSLDV